jgi:aryl-alcohol dehydrogenase-like predicted oxidoreductase
LEKRRLGKSDLMVSVMGLGCMSLGTEPNKAKEIVKAAIDAGINFFDSADLYDFGENETILGTILRPIRDKVLIATKAGNRWNEQKTGWSWDPSKAYIKDAVKASLKRLNTDYIDLYQLHGGTIEDPVDETIEAFEELKTEGLIRYYGISSIRPNVIREYATKSNMVSVMMQYSLLDRRPEETALPLLDEHGISVVTRGSLAKGLLSEKALERVGNFEKGYLNYSVAELKDILEKLKAVTNRPLQEVALQYNLAHPAVASVIVGASLVEQVKENVAAVQSSPLTKEELAAIRVLTKEQRYAEHR